MLTFEGYNAAGGIRGAIAKTADAVYQYQLNPEQKKIAEHIFVNLTEIGDAQDTRRRAPLDTLYRAMGEKELVDEVLTILTRARLIFIGEETAEVTHEALIREWPALRRWLDDNRDGLRIRRELQDDAREWVELARDKGALYRGTRLARALEWQAGGEHPLDALSQEFLEMSHQAAMQEEAEREAQRQRELTAAQKLAEEQERRAEEQAKSAARLGRNNRRLGILLVIALILMVTTIYAAIQAFQLRDQAKLEEAESKTTDTPWRVLVH